MIDYDYYATFDVSFVLPTEVLPDNYIVQTYEGTINNSGPSSSRWYSVCLIVATEDSTVVDVIPSANTSTGWNANTNYSITLNAGQCYELRASDIGTTLSGTHIQSRDCKKIAVFGAHECAYIPNSKVQYHYVNVVTKTSNVNNVVLDGNSIASQFGPVISNPSFSYARISVSQGYHRLKSTSADGFVANAYGVGSNESYGYSVGFHTRPNAPYMVINDSVYKTDSIEVAICEGGLLFSVAGIETYDSIVWSKDGGEYTTSDSVLYDFAVRGDYSVCAFVSCNGGSCRAKVDTICATIHVKGALYDTVAVDTCEGVYWWRNKSFVQSGVYSDTISSADGCDSIHSLVLNFYSSVTVDACEGVY